MGWRNATVLQMIGAAFAVILMVWLALAVLGIVFTVLGLA